jgi:hypothetical protein
MDPVGPIDKMPQKQSSIRQAEILMEYSESRGKERVQEMNARMEHANAATTVVETSIKGALVNKNSI